MTEDRDQKSDDKKTEDTSHRAWRIDTKAYVRKLGARARDQQPETSDQQQEARDQRLGTSSQ
jgi:hypothetical protein